MSDFEQIKAEVEQEYGSLPKMVVLECKECGEQELIQWGDDFCIGCGAEVVYPDFLIPPVVVMKKKEK